MRTKLATGEINDVNKPTAASLAYTDVGPLYIVNVFRSKSVTSVRQCKTSGLCLKRTRDCLLGLIPYRLTAKYLHS
jgi:hypothetical protein